MALTRVVVDWVDIGVGGAEVGVSRECGVTETSPPSNPALAWSVIVFSPSTPSPNLTITSLEHIVTKCRYDSERNGKDKESQRRYHSFKPSAACYHLATVKTCEGALSGLGSGWGQVFQGCKVQLKVKFRSFLILFQRLTWPVRGQTRSSLTHSACSITPLGYLTDAMLDCE